MADIPSITAPSINFSYTQQHLLEFLIQGYVNVVGYFFWPLVFSGLVVYIYVKNKSVVAASVGIIIIIAGFAGSGVFLHVPVVVMFFQLIIALSISGLVVIFLMRRR